MYLLQVDTCLVFPVWSDEINYRHASAPPTLKSTQPCDPGPPHGCSVCQERDPHPPPSLIQHSLPGGPLRRLNLPEIGIPNRG